MKWIKYFLHINNPYNYIPYSQPLTFKNIPFKTYFSQLPSNIKHFFTHLKYI